MRILILVPEQDRATGNWVTAARLTKGLESAGHRPVLLGVAVDSGQQLNRMLAQFRPEAALLLHAFRSGQPWLQAQTAQIPMLVLLTGTDVNQGLEDPRQAPVIRQVLDRAGAILLQNQALLRTLQTLHPELAARIHYLPAGVALGNAPWDVRRKLGLPPEKTLLLCPAGVRPVKGVLELLKMGDALAEHRSDFHLAFCGPLLDHDYAERFLQAVAERPWASYLGVIPPSAMAAALRSASLVVSNSAHEGLPNTLLEADAVGVPILASAVPGNTEVVQPGENGFLFRDTDSFVACVLQLMAQPPKPRPVLDPARREGESIQESAVLQALLLKVAEQEPAGRGVQTVPPDSSGTRPI